MKRVDIPADHPLADIPPDELRELAYALAQIIARAYLEEHARKAEERDAA